LRVNLFRFGGFPQITVEHVEAGFSVKISVGSKLPSEASFMLKPGGRDSFRAGVPTKPKRTRTSNLRPGTGSFGSCSRLL
jgi:hypothetical protein